MGDPVKRKRGGQLTYDREIAHVICLELAKGRTLKAICRQEGFPPESTVRNWAMDDVDGFNARYAQARQLGLDTMFDELLEIADDSSRDYKPGANGNLSADHEHINRSRLRIDTRKWYLAKLAPKRYGDRLAVEASGADGGPLVVVTGVPRDDRSDTVDLSCRQYGRRRAGSAMKRKRLLNVLAIGLLILLAAATPAEAAPYPDSKRKITLEWQTQRRLAWGSDNWPASWGADGKTYAVWGDGGGFEKRYSYVSIGIAALTGTTAATLEGVNLIGGYQPTIAACVPLLRGTIAEYRSWSKCPGHAHAKGYGVLALGSDLYVWTHPGSCVEEYRNATLHRLRIGTNQWTSATWSWFGQFSPTFVQAGQDHQDSVWIHLYAIRQQVRSGQARYLSPMGAPKGEVLLARAKRDADLLRADAWQWWNGRRWGDGTVKAAVFTEPAGIGPKISAIYLKDPGRYILVTEVGAFSGGRMAFHEAPSPMGPWTKLLEIDFPPSTFFANILPQSVRGNRFTIGFSGMGAYDALMLVDASIQPR
jgi:hypothetical protein